MRKDTTEDLEKETQDTTTKTNIETISQGETKEMIGTKGTKGKTFPTKETILESETIEHSKMIGMMTGNVLIEKDSRKDKRKGNLRKRNSKGSLEERKVLSRRSMKSTQDKISSGSLPK